MRNIFISLVSNCPKGFDFKMPSKRELLSNNVAIFTDSLENAYSLLDDFTKRVNGIIITLGDKFSHKSIGSKLFSLTITDDTFENTFEITSAYLEMMSNAFSKIDENQSLKIELARLNKIQTQNQKSNFENLQRLGTKIEVLRNEILEREQTERKLNSERVFTDKITQSLPGLFYIYDLKTDKFARRNKNWLEITGYSEEEFEEITVLDLLVDKDLAEKKINEALESGSSSMENILLTKNGDEIPYFFTGEKLVLDERKYLIGMGMNISMQKNAEENLLESEARYKTLVENAPEAIVVFDLDLGTFVEANKNAEKLYGLSKKELLKSNPFKLSPTIQPNGKSSEELGTKLLQLSYDGKIELFEWVHLNQKTGQKIDCEIRLVRLPSSKRKLVRGSIIDITERKNAEKIIQENEERLKMATKIAKLGYYDWNFDEGELHWDKQMHEIFGLPLNSNLSRNEYFNQLIHKDDFDRITTEFKNSLEIKNKKTVFESHFKIVVNGKIKHIEFHSLHFRNKDGKVKRIIGTCIDITNQKNIEEELRKSEEHLRTTLNSIGDAMIATDNNGLITGMNPVAEKLTGWKFEEVLNTPLSEIFNIYNFHTKKPAKNPVKQVIETGEIVGLENNTVLISKDGTEYQIADSAAPIKDKDENITGVILIFRDVSNEYAMREKLHQSQKMDAIGQLAGGVAHDFNNMISGIIGSAELLGVTNNFDSKSQNYLDIIIKSSNRAADLTAKLLAFGRKAKITTSVVDVLSILEDTISILYRSIDKKISINLNCNSNNNFIVGDNSQLHNAFLNMGINSAQAMPNGGKLTFLTKNVYLDKLYCQNSQFEISPGNYIEVSIKDEGVGISFENQAKIFEPFFTTKKGNRGTGLGLPAVYGTVINHKGAIQVHSEVGIGTIFHLYFPLSNQKTEKVQIEKNENIIGSGTILVIDDEEFIRDVTKAILETLGYNVILAKDGLEGIETFQNNIENIDLVITDMIMPRMNGREVFCEIKKLKPDCKIILVSGFSQQEDINYLLENGLNASIQKPFVMAEFSKIINQVLGNKS